MNKMFWVYILHCADDSYYTGHTDNLEIRIAQHQAGECAGYTATRRPLELIWSQECFTREEALSAERQIKGWSHKKKEAMMRGDWDEVSRLAKSKSTLRLFDKLTAQGERSQQAFSSELVEESGRTDLLLQRAMDE
jgi:putative endonuclease